MEMSTLKKANELVSANKRLEEANRAINDFIDTLKATDKEKTLFMKLVNNSFNSEIKSNEQEIRRL